MNNANTLHPFTSAWDAPRPGRGRKGFIIAVTAIFFAHGLLVIYLYESTFEPRYAPAADEPPVIATVIHPEASPPPPQPSQHPKTAAPLVHPRMAAPPPIDFKEPDALPLPPVDKLTVVGPTTPSHTIEVKPRILTNPQFDRKPNADDLAQYYPERADRLGKEGSAAIRCTVSAKGALVGCIVVNEDPAAFGFGDAALKLAKVFKLKPATADGAPVDGGVFSTKITFKLPE